MDTAKQPTNLLVTFLEYCSVISQDIKGSLCEIWSVSLALVVILSVRLPKWLDAHFCLAGDGNRAQPKHTLC